MNNICNIKSRSVMSMFYDTQKLSEYLISGFLTFDGNYFAETLVMLCFCNVINHDGASAGDSLKIPNALDDTILNRFCAFKIIVLVSTSINFVFCSTMIFI